MTRCDKFTSRASRIQMIMFTITVSWVAAKGPDNPQHLHYLKRLAGLSAAGKGDFIEGVLYYRTTPSEACVTSVVMLPPHSLS